jgi:putative glutamine amidotransferase
VVAPVIGIVIDSINAQKYREHGGYSQYPWYAIGRRYSEAIVRYGGIPVLICNNLSSVPRYAEILDGLLISGTAADVDPIFYGETFHHKTTLTHATRTQFDIAIARQMLDRDKPILGINYGTQLINVIHGGTLFQHIAEEIPGAIWHNQEQLLVYTQHSITVQPNTRLCELFLDAMFGDQMMAPPPRAADLKFDVNSHHHQSVKTLGHGLKIAAIADDGVVESIESSSSKFCVGVQWHAEFLSTPIDPGLFKSFIDASRG